MINTTIKMTVNIDEMVLTSVDCSRFGARNTSIARISPQLCWNGCKARSHWRYTSKANMLYNWMYSPEITSQTQYLNIIGIYAYHNGAEGWTEFTHYSKMFELESTQRRGESIMADTWKECGNRIIFCPFWIMATFPTFSTHLQVNIHLISGNFHRIHRKIIQFVIKISFLTRGWIHKLDSSTAENSASDTITTYVQRLRCEVARYV